MRFERVPNLDELYVVLRSWATRRPGLIKTYTDLSNDYYSLTNVWFEPHGSWDQPLGALNQTVHDMWRAPAISALVVKKEHPTVVSSKVNMPGRAFWGSASNVPPYPASDRVREVTWLKIVNDVHAFEWPAALR